MVNAQNNASDTARPIAGDSTVRSGLFGGVTLRLAMDKSVPYKVRYLDNPYRIAIEFDGLTVDSWPEDFGKKSFRVDDFAFGNVTGGARMVLHFDKAYRVDEIAMSPKGDYFELKAKIRSIDPDDYQALVANLGYEGRDLGYILPKVEGAAKLPLIVIDPGHGGIDPGAIRDNVREKDVTLVAAMRIEKFLLNSGRYRVALTRDDDVFLTLSERRRLAEQLAADLYLSIHADTVEVGDATGMTIYLLSEEASSVAAQKFAEFENRVDVFAGALSARDETDLNVTLLDMAQRSSNEKSQKVAALIFDQWQGLREGDQKIRIEHANFGVLKSPEIPSVLLEIGFLSNDNDRARIQDPKWLGEMAQTVLVALDQFF